MRGEIRIERSWYKGKIEPPKNGRPRKVGIDYEIFGLAGNVARPN